MTKIELALVLAASAGWGLAIGLLGEVMTLKIQLRFYNRVRKL